MNEKKILAVVLCLIPLWLFMAGEEHHSGDISEFLGKTVNFLILFGGLGLLLYRPVRNYFENRGQDISISIKEAEELCCGSQKKLKEAKSRMERMAEEVKKIAQDSEAEGNKRKKDILFEAREEADKLKKFAKNEIDMLSQTGMEEIRAYVAELAVRKARERLMKKIGDPEHRFLIDQSIEKLSQFYEKPSSH